MTDKVPDTPRTAFSESSEGAVTKPDTEGAPQTERPDSSRSLNDFYAEPDTVPDQPQTLNETFADTSATTTLNDTFPVRPLEHTPFHEKDVEVSAIEKAGVYVRHPLKSFNELDADTKQNAMYILQATAAAGILAGGGMEMAAGASFSSVGGYVITGGLSCVRSIGQYLNRRFGKASSGDPSTEKDNSGASVGTNLFQAADSGAAQLSVFSYVWRYSLLAAEEEDWRKEHPEAVKENQEVDESELENNEASVLTSKVLGPIKTGLKAIQSHVIDPPAAKLGHKLQEYESSKSIPGYTQIGRAFKQTAEGVAFASPPMIFAGGLYLMAATAMQSADSQGPDHESQIDHNDQFENHDDENEEYEEYEGDIESQAQETVASSTPAAP